MLTLTSHVIRLRYFRARAFYAHTDVEPEPSWKNVHIATLIMCFIMHIAVVNVMRK